MTTEQEKTTQGAENISAKGRSYSFSHAASARRQRRLSLEIARIEQAPQPARVASIAGELAWEHGVDERTIRADLRALRANRTKLHFWWANGHELVWGRDRVLTGRWQP